MTKTRHIVICWMTITIIIVSHPLIFLMGANSLQQYYQAFGQAIEGMDSNNLPAIDGIECDRVEHLTFHTHTQLNMTINNQSYSVPAGIGIIQDYCIYWLHTHDNSGLIHIESPIQREFTLGQFLRIWNKFNSSDLLVQNIADNNITGTLMVYVNGTQMIANNSMDYRDLALKDGSNVSLIISPR
jgi:hypothetical protein